MYRSIEPPLDPPDPCDHDVRGYCDECEEERQAYEDMEADWAYERWKLGE